MADTQLNLVQKLAKIRAISDVAMKSKRGFNYSYTDITEILANVTTGMKKYGVSLIPSITQETAHVEKIETRSTKFTKTGEAYENVTTEMLVSADMTFRWINDDDVNDYIDVAWFFVGSQSDPSQAMGSGLTYAQRYFLTSFFQIAQSDMDVDAYRSKQKAAAAKEDKAVAEEIIHEFDTILKAYLSDHEDKAEEIKKFISRYEKKSNYFAIKEPALASKLLTDFNQTYLKEGE